MDTLPAGTDVDWTDPSHTDIESAVLPVPATLLGTVWIGEIQFTGATRNWIGTLGEDSTIDGWTCHAGDFLSLKDDRGLEECTLAADRHLGKGFTVPAGTDVQIMAGYADIDLQLPADRTVKLAGVVPAVAGGSRLTIHVDGSIKRIHGAFTVGGVALNGDIEFLYPGTPDDGLDMRTEFPTSVAVSGQLAQDYVLRGEKLESGSNVTVRLSDGAVSSPEE